MTGSTTKYFFRPIIVDEGQSRYLSEIVKARFGVVEYGIETIDGDQYDYSGVDDLVAYINGALNVAFRDAFYMTHKMQGEIADVAVYFKMEVRRQVSLLLHSKAKYRYSIATVLYDIAKTVKVVGDKTVKV